jgi:hypothetical protein
MKRKLGGALGSIAAAGLVATPALVQAQAQNRKVVPQIEYIAAVSHPPMPAGLQLVCTPQSNQGAAAAPTCAVVKYQGISTWAYSFLDNRGAFALVSYDANNNVVRNAEKPGARYLFNATVSEPNQTVTFVGQAERFVTVPWSELGAAK